MFPMDDVIFTINVVFMTPNFTSSLPFSFCFASWAFSVPLNCPQLCLDLIVIEGSHDFGGNFMSDMNNFFEVRYNKDVGCLPEVVALGAAAIGCKLLEEVHKTRSIMNTELLRSIDLLLVLVISVAQVSGGP